MQKNGFRGVAARQGNEKWEEFVGRSGELYSREGDVRSPFARDYTRILHSTAYRRLKHKTQVFFNAANDHVCTRMEHVAHVESVAYTIALYLGLNDELTKAIAFGHDLGHAPFGHWGEHVLNEITTKYCGETFWHERNGLRLVDSLELLEDDGRVMRNLNLTYAVRDGIVSHCGEIDSNGIKPREEAIDLQTIRAAGEVQPFSWEGCVVKLADKIAYLGRDIEDALSLGFLSEDDLREQESFAADGKAVNTTVIMHGVIADVCKNSSPQCGIKMSDGAFERLSAIKAFNYDKIYKNPRFNAFQNYATLIINTLFGCLDGLYCGADTFSELKKFAAYSPVLGNDFYDWLAKYCSADVLPADREEYGVRYCNLKPYGDLGDRTVYRRAIIDFISGMTDPFAIKLFEEQLNF